MIINKEEPRKKILGVGGIRKGGIIKEMGIRRHMDDDGVDSDEELQGFMSDGLDNDNDSTTGFGHDVNDLLPPPARTALGPGLGVGSRIEHNEGNYNDGAVVTTETSEKSSLDVGKGNYDGW